MAKKTEEDWFLRGGERPDPANGNDNAASVAPDAHDSTDDGDGETLRDYVVTMTRLKTVRQTAKVRVKARNECEAMDLADERAPDESGKWDWKDVDWDSEEFEDVEAEDAEVAT